ncbi:hypothetical protein Tco_0727416 [Tanacetum coccineum]|uniref:Uncharacterized protein n=1 Tax=Tanacetum coccineum TaxID=301880 RepID=A0ABQ4YIV8_9ASTR
MTVERSLGRGFRKFESRKLSALKGLTLKNLVPSMKELLSKTSTSFAMLAMNKMIGALLLKLGIGITLRSWIQHIQWFFSLVGGKEEHDHETVHPGSWSRPINYDPTPYVLNITTHANYDTRHPSSYTSIQNPIRHLVHRLLTLSVVGRHSGKEKVTMDDLFLLHNMDGGVSVDVPWYVAKFLCDKAKGSKRKSPIVGAHLIRRIASYYGLMTLRVLMNVTLGPETSSMSVANLVNLGICKYNGLGIGEIVAEIPEVARDDDDRAEQAEIGGREIVNDVNELTYVVSGMSEQYDQFYGDFGQWQTEKERVQQGVNFMSGTPGYSTAPSPSASQFGMFSDTYPSSSRNQDDINED